MSHLSTPTQRFERRSLVLVQSLDRNGRVQGRRCTFQDAQGSSLDVHDGRILQEAGQKRKVTLEAGVRLRRAALISHQRVCQRYELLHLS